MQTIRKHLSYANVIATVALFLALGGTAWALSKNSVGTKQLKNNAVTQKKIKNGAVTAKKIANGAVTGQAISPTSFNITVHRVAWGPGPPLLPGEAGGVTATCPTGKKAIAGGGLSDNGGADGVVVEDSRPVTGTTTGAVDGGTFTGWRMFWKNNTNPAVAAIPVAYVVCLG